MFCSGMLVNQNSNSKHKSVIEIDDAEQFRITRDVIQQVRMEALEKIPIQKQILYDLEARVRTCDETLKII